MPLNFILELGYLSMDLKVFRAVSERPVVNNMMFDLNFIDGHVC
jgi:hypothetical protein